MTWISGGGRGGNPRVKARYAGRATRAGVLRTAREADTCGPIQLMKPSPLGGRATTVCAPLPLRYLPKFTNHSPTCMPSNNANNNMPSSSSHRCDERVAILTERQTQVAAAPTANVALLTTAGFLFYVCGYMALFFTTGLDVHRLRPYGAYSNTTASQRPSSPTEVHYLYLWMDSHFDAEVLRHMSYAADIIAPPVMH